ncbi:MAG: hypothetical protein KKA62_05150 [Nanoarchaeota archaeon]|nr:hypothetical protein [Nanoarchaeota archaeon]MBU1644067.1 hypothetical protein [Nanoarchaeota archaeon]MBU1977309.1 hypothetical protein [Nanoarchaeota archaeon]
MITLVVGGIFFLLFMNNDNESGLTSAIVGYSAPKDTQLNSTEITSDFKEEDLKELVGNELGKSTKNADLSLTFDSLPTVKNKAKIENLELKFDGPESLIKVNGNKLDLNNINDVGLNLINFDGEIDFENNYLSLDGKTELIEINGITFSSEEAIEISLNNLDYHYLSVSDIELKGLELKKGSGELEINGRLNYKLEEESLKMFYFRGRMDVDKGSSSVSQLSLDGEVLGLSVSGDLMNFNLR